MSSRKQNQSVEMVNGYFGVPKAMTNEQTVASQNSIDNIVDKNKKAAKVWTQ